MGQKLDTSKNWFLASPRLSDPFDFLYLTTHLPKTRSGKVMRRILRKIAEGDISNLADTSMLTDPEVVQALLLRQNVV